MNNLFCQKHGPSSHHLKSSTHWGKWYQYGNSGIIFLERVILTHM